jgi:hypothetical protein
VPDDGTAVPDDGTAVPDDGTAVPDDGTAVPCTWKQPTFCSLRNTKLHKCHNIKMSPNVYTKMVMTLLTLLYN